MDIRYADETARLFKHSGNKSAPYNTFNSK